MIQFYDKKIIIFGISRTEMDLKLQDFAKRFKKINLKMIETFPEIHLEIKVQEQVQEEAGSLLDSCIRWFREQFKDRLVSIEGQSLEIVVGRLLNQQNATIAIAESCTGGLISHKLTNVPGSSDYFLFSGIVYSNQTKINILGVAPETIKKFGAVHTLTAMEMAKGVRRISGADYGISTTGIAGPGGGTQSKPVGTVCVGFASSEKTDGFQLNFSFNDRFMTKEIFAASALDLLRRKLLE